MEDDVTVAFETSEVPAAAQPQPALATGGAGPRGVGLAMKFFAAAAALVLATLGTALAVVTWRANVVAERTIREGLANVPTSFRAYKADLEDRITAQVRSLAEQPGTKAVFADGVSVATRYEFSARDAVSVLGANTVFLFDRESLVLARNDKPEGEGLGKPFGAVKWVADPLWNRRDAAAAIVEKGQLALVAASAIVSGEGSEARVDGVLAATFPFGASEVEALKGITRGEVGFVSNSARVSEAPELKVDAATAGFRGEDLLRALASGGAVPKLFVEGAELGPLDLDIAGESRLLLGIPVKSAAGDTLGAFVVTRSRSEETAAFREIRNVLLLVGLLLLAVSMPISFLMGRRIAQPLAQLTQGAVAIREGHLDVRLPQERGDEVGALARAFQGMVEELREKRALQQLLEEMRRRPVTPEPDTEAKTSEPAAGPTASEAGPVVGETFGSRYRIIDVLGKGGMGRVYRATDVELEDVVALKVLSPEAFVAGSQVMETLKREIRLARRITHPNVVRVHDLGEAGSIRFVSMEYVPGTTLRALLGMRVALGLGPGLQIIKQVCRGLAAIHGAGILHRDIKSENVMVLPDGMVKLMDFGIAEVLGELSKAKGSKFVVGTPHYMSPEQLKSRPVDGRSDLYAVGVLMYEVFAGVLPFTGSTITEIVQKSVLREPESPAKHRPELPQALVDLILQCLSKEPAGRPVNAQSLYAALLRVPSGTAAA